MMQAALNHDQHRAARRQAGGPAYGGFGAPSNAAHQIQSPPCRANDLPRARKLGRVAKSTDRLFFRRGWATTPNDLAAFITRTYAGLTAEQVAALLHFQSADHSPCRVTDLPPVHLEHHSVAVRYIPTRSERIVGSVQEGVGDYQNEDC